ncbi:cathepsin 8 [Onthophagus taurus]|uniref:cathepsin 8 n=1 Tax=Onthophagus taurus TaxID=166361 RepID=UPI000C2024B2|nr:cathepsin L1 [Onthophagus taurus]
MQQGNIVFLCLISLIFSSSLPDQHLDNLWNDFKNKFNKSYSGNHDVNRRKAWENNLNLIKSHNQQAEMGEHSYLIQENYLADLSPRVYLQKMIKLTQSSHRKIDVEMVGDIFEKINHLPDEIDWRKEGFTTPVFNQKDCGSCYAFSIACVLQAQIFKNTNKLVPLSEQQIVDCSKNSGNFGCSGGSLRNTLKYLDKVGGLMAFDDYPYVAKENKCKYDSRKTLVNVTSWSILPSRNEKALQKALVKIGPIAVSINARPRTFQLYHKGIYDDQSCESNTVNHAMLLVGYTKDAWILKNWWGNRWGENGYMRLKRNKNRCGIANFAAYALV